MMLTQTKLDNMFLPTRDMIHHGGAIANLYPRFGDFTQVELTELQRQCLARGVSIDNVIRAIKAATGFDLRKPDVRMAEAYGRAVERLADKDADVTLQTAWPLDYTSTRWPGNEARV